MTSLDSGITKSKFAKKGVVWSFNPPYAPHVEGTFESMIKSVKQAIDAVLSSSDVNDVELMTAFISSEALLNSKPLTYQSAHTPDDVLIAPIDFLHGQHGMRLRSRTNYNFLYSAEGLAQEYERRSTNMHVIMHFSKMTFSLTVDKIS